MWHQYRKEFRRGWPRWDSTTHQQIHVAWLKKTAQRKDKYAMKVIFLTVTKRHALRLARVVVGGVS